MAKFVEGYFNQYKNVDDGWHEAASDLVEEYMPQRGNLPRDDEGDFLDQEMQDRYEWGIVLLEAREFDSFFAWMGFSAADIAEFWDDYREAYGAV